MRAILLAMLVIPLASCNMLKSNKPISCPVAQIGQAGDAVRETPAQIAAAGHELRYGNSNALPDVIAGVRQRHPAATKTEVVNYLMTAYCPTLNADPALDRGSRNKAMQSFAKQAEAAVQ